MRYLLAALLFFSGLAPAAAQDAAEGGADAERLSRDMISDVDGWIGRVNEKIQSDKPVTDEDFDSVFGESFFSESPDPERDIELARERMSEKLGDHKQFNDSYGKWVERKLSPADLDPEVVRGRRHIAVNLKTPGLPPESLKVTVARGRIRVSYPQTMTRRDLQPDGTVKTSSSTFRRYHAMEVPAEADPARYQLRQRKGGVSVIFDRLKKGRKSTEATK